jgi:hypothetical protein
MIAAAKARNFAIVTGIALALSAATAGATHADKPRKPERPHKPATVQTEPEKRQNFRARRPDEIPPWEGFEDCPMAFPCVGMINPY